ncbi:MAG: hypothetical protein IJ287_07425 [Methanobrevibacter sp.]|nr:hypothetical protein [Methanobrevibacter sp.]
MNFFVDTNIPLGYTVIHDKWHEKSKTFIENHANDSIFWSTLVKKEYRKKLNDIIDEVRIFLEYCKSILKTNQRDFINYFEFENFIIKKTKVCTLDYAKKQKILEEFWNSTALNEGIAEMVYLNSVNFFMIFKNYTSTDKIC